MGGQKEAQNGQKEAQEPPSIPQGGCLGCQSVADIDFARARRALEKKTPARREEFLRQIGWRTLKGRGGRARRLRAAPLDLGDGTGHPFAPCGHRPPLAIPGRTVLTYNAATQHFFEHLRKLPRADRQAHLEGAPDWMRAAYRNAGSALDLPDERQWEAAKVRLTRALLADRLGLDVRTVRSHERAAWDWVARLKPERPG